MKVIIPMAGIGKKFLESGYKDPKPLIVVDGKPMIEHLVSMFSLEDDFIFICNKMHKETTDMEAVLKGVAPNATIIWIEKYELGAVYNVTYAFDYVKDDEPVIVCYCDLYESWDYDDFKKTMAETGCDAAVTAYKGFHPHLLGDGLYASMRADGNWMLECREKFSFTPNKMDSFQQTGKFYFASGKIIKKYFMDAINRNLTFNNEFYASAVTQLLVEAGLRVYIYPVEHFLQWGAPKDFEDYVKWSVFFRTETPEPDPSWDKNTLDTFNYWQSFFKKCHWHPFGKRQ